MSDRAIADDTLDSADRLRYYLDVAELGCWTYQPASDAFFADARAARYLIGDEHRGSFTAEEFLDRVHPADRSAVARHLQEHEDAPPILLTFRVSDQHNGWYTLTLKGRQEDAEQISGVVSCERVVGDDAKPSESELIGMVVDAIPFPVMYITSDGYVDFVNKTFRRATRTTETQIQGQTAAQVLDPEELDNGTKAFLECLSGKRVFREGPSAVEGMPIRFCRYVYEPVRDKSGNVLGVCATVIDLTDVKEAKEALLASHTELERSNRDLEQFAYVASHDLKAPLRAIEVLVGWLSEDLAEYPSEDVQENLDLLNKRTARLNRLLDDLLSYSRAGRPIGEQSLVDCNQLVEDICALIGVPETFVVDAGCDVPKLATHAASLEQVLRNLISNAIKHHPGPSGHISVSAERMDDHYVFSVIDDGAGIPEEYSERVFEMFQTLKPRDEVESSGMGLAIVSRIVESQGGRVWFEPAPSGTGTAFKFDWRFTEADAN